VSCCPSQSEALRRPSRTSTPSVETECQQLLLNGDGAKPATTSQELPLHGIRAFIGQDADNQRVDVSGPCF
jgi:hypothetical protein